jgi:tryptophanyl-tRNA synthetase
MEVAVTGIKPTGSPHLGNYLGMMRPALSLAERYEALYFIADYHALTSLQDGSQVRRLSHEAAATWLAFGLDPQRAALYRQSDLPEVCELAWVLLCVTPKGLLNRAHAYKAAVEGNQSRGRDSDAGVSMGLFNYPVLMAADILYPGGQAVPVGLDQKQHLEMADDIARAFNAAFGEILTVPDPIIDPHVMTIPGLDGRKMSKSYGNLIPVFAAPDEIRRAVMHIKTASRRSDEPKDPETDTIFSLYRHVAREADVITMRERYRRGGIGYAEAKEELIIALERMFCEPRRRYMQIAADVDYVESVLATGAERARERGSRIMEKVRRAIGAGAESRSTMNPSP